LRLRQRPHTQAISVTRATPIHPCSVPPSSLRLRQETTPFTDRIQWIASLLRLRLWDIPSQAPLTLSPSLRSRRLVTFRGQHRLPGTKALLERKRCAPLLASLWKTQTTNEIDSERTLLRLHELRNHISIARLIALHWSAFWGWFACCVCGFRVLTLRICYTALYELGDSGKKKVIWSHDLPLWASTLFFNIAASTVITIFLICTGLYRLGPLFSFTYYAF
jgi:hypothetical protein